MDKEYLIGLLMNMTSKYKVNIDAEMLGKIVNMSAFRIVEKGAVIQHIVGFYRHLLSSLFR